MMLDPAFRLVLASASATRARLLQSAGLAFAVRAAAIDERAVERADLGELAAALAREKALAVSAREGRSLVIGADQVLSLDGRAIHKSPTPEAALATLLALAGRTHRLTSAFAIARGGEVVAQGAGVAEMTMRPLGPAALRLYLEAAGPEALDSVGVYHFEGLGAHLFERVEGEHSTILGLPMLALLAALRRLGALTL